MKTYGETTKDLAEEIGQETIHILIEEYELFVWDTKSLPSIFKRMGWGIPSEEEEVLFSYSWEEGILSWREITGSRSRCTIGRTPCYLVPNSCGL